jgi:hypothetical protein
MCFSPAASFIAGGVLVTAGIFTMKQAKSQRARPFAAVPLLFGIQQVIEGFVWSTFDRPVFHSAATVAYVLFSHVIWPTFLPFAVWRLEADDRRKWLAPFVFIGGVISVTLLAYLLQGPVTSDVVGRCIVYTVPLPHVPFGLWAYVLATCGSCLASSNRFVRVFGITMLGSLGIAYWSYHEQFYSVWCFFAAILSLIVFIQLRQESEKITARPHEPRKRIGPKDRAV